jgi:hypothetical protein
MGSACFDALRAEVRRVTGGAVALADGFLARVAGAELTRAVLVVFFFDAGGMEDDGWKGYGLWWDALKGKSEKTTKTVKTKDEGENFSLGEEEAQREICIWIRV